MKKKGHVYKNMLISYILILLIPILISSALYYYVYDVVKGQAELYNRNLIRTIQNICDRESEYYKSYLLQIKLTDSTKTLLSSIDYQHPDDYWNNFVTHRELADIYYTIQARTNDCRDVFVYIGATDKVINQSSIMSLDLYSSLYCNEAETAELREFLQEGNSKEAYYFQKDTGEEFIIFTEPLVKRNNKDANAVAGVCISTEAFDSLIKSINWEGGSDWTIIDASGQSMRRMEQLDASTIDFDGTADMEENSNREIDGISYLLNTLDSETMGWKYVLFTPESYIVKSANQVRNLSILCLVVSILIGYWLAKSFMKMNYSPIRELMKLFTKSDEEREFENEYGFLKEHVSGLLDNYSDIRKEMNQSKEVLRRYVLEEMLSMSVIPTEETTQMKQEIYKEFDDGNNLVLLCCVKENWGKLKAGEKTIAEMEQCCFIVSNVYAEGIGKIYQVETVEMDNKVVLLVHLSSQQEADSEKLEAVIEKLRDFIEKNFEFTVCTFEGRCYPGVEGIHNSYLEACETEAFSQYLDEEYIRYEDIRDLTLHKYEYSFEMEELIVSALREKNPQLALSFIYNVLENNFSKTPKISNEMMTCLLYDILGTIVKTSEDLGTNNDPILMSRYITAESSLEEIKCFFANAVEDIYKEVEQDVRNSYKKDFYDEVLLYISENYADPDLNVSTTALHFHITSTYLSSNFKKCTGKSIMEVIRQTRIDQARLLLKEGYSVTEVSQMVGFRECATFIRTFKKCTGVTPGQFSKIDKK